MKKYLIIALSVAALGMTACSEDTLDEINVNNGNPSPEVVPAYLQLSEAIMNVGFSTISGDYAFYLSSLNEQEIGVGNNQLMKAELRNSGEWAASTTFNNAWGATYANLQNIYQMIQKIEDGTNGNAEQYAVLGMAQVLKSLSFGILTSLHGDIPYSEAILGSNNLQPKLDAQKDVYAGVLKTLDEAIANLQKGQTFTTAQKQQDLLFGGDTQSWIAFAYALKARYLIHQTAVDSSVIAQAETAAQQAADLGFSGALITEFNGVSCDNPWSAFYWSRGYTASSTTVTKLMEKYDDPRLDPYTYYTGEAYDPGDEEIAKVSDWSLALPVWYDFGSQPIHVMSKGELYFILAEAQLRQGKDATDAFNTAVEAALTDITDITGDYDDSVIADYVANLGTPTLQALFEQKYLSQINDEQVEAYNDLRRLKAMGEEYVVLTNPYNTQSGINRYPERLPYGNGSVLSNPNVKAAYGDGSYIYSDKTWVNGGK